MDLLAGYGSGSDAEEDAASLPPTAMQPTTQTPPAPPPSGQDTAQALETLPAPGSSKPALFTGLPPASRTRKKVVAQFRIPIDYGGPPEKAALVDEEDDAARHKRLRAGTAGKPQSLAELLPPPMHASVASGRPLEAEPVLGGGGSARFDTDDDDDLVPGIEDRTGMLLGADDASADASGDATAAASADAAAPIALGNEAYRVDAGAARAVPSHFLQGTHNGQPYYCDPTTGQYYYPDPEQQPRQAPRPPGRGGTRGAAPDPAAAELEAAMAAEASRLGGGGIQFKEVSAAAIRYMDPSQRAGLDAMRSALGADYEGRLRAEAAKVGDVSKRAKSRHQISSLYVYAKEQELEQLEKRTTAMKSKAETQRKYGW